MSVESNKHKSGLSETFAFCVADDEVEVAPVATRVVCLSMSC